MRNFCRENGKRYFSCEEMVVTTPNKVKIRKIRGKERENSKNKLGARFPPLHSRHIHAFIHTNKQ